GSWGGNVTSDNISPLHLMDIKRVAFETRPVTVIAEPPVQSLNPSTQPRINPTERRVDGGVEIEAITTLVDRFISARRQTPKVQEDVKDIKDVKDTFKENGAKTQPPATPLVSPVFLDKSESNGHRAVDFVCEADVKQALAVGEKIYVNAKTIITPAARELGEQREVFARAG